MEYEKQKKQLDVAYYAGILRKNRLPILLTTLLVTALAAYYASSVTPVYRATSTLLIEPQGSNVVSIEQLIGVETQAQDYYATQFVLLSSRSLAKKVINALDLWDHPEFTDDDDSKLRARIDNLIVDAKSLVKQVIQPSSSKSDVSLANETGKEGLGFDEAAANEVQLINEKIQLLKQSKREAIVTRFLSGISVAPIDGTKLVEIGFESNDPVISADIANMVGDQYITNYLDTRLQRTASAASWLGSRVSELKATLDESEQRLLAFKEDKGLIDIEGRIGRLDEQEVIQTTIELGRAQARLFETRNIYEQTRALAGDYASLLTLPSVLADQFVQRVRIDKNEAQRTLDELSNRYGGRHPRIQDARSKLQSIDLELENQVARVVGAIEKEYFLSRERVAAVRSKMESEKSAIQSLGASEFKLEALQREVSTNREIYETFFNRMSEARSADGLESANATVSDRAIPPDHPIKPRKTLIVALAAMMSLIICTFLVFLLDQLDSTLSSISEVEERLMLPLLGVLPKFKGVGLRFKKSSLHERSTSSRAFTESINAIRTTISLWNDSKRHQILVVTSSVPGEGKSTVSLNLAHAFGQIERTLLIEGDLRRPTFAKVIGQGHDSPGLSNLILGDTPASECIQQLTDSWHVLTAGPKAVQPLELLSSNRFENILESLRSHYDRIIIDSAPVQSVSDALVLGKIGDALIYIVKPKQTPLDLVQRCLQRIRDVDIPILGVVLTQVRPKQLDSYAGEDKYNAYYNDVPHRGSVFRRGEKWLHLSQKELMRLKKDDRPVELDLVRKAPNTQGEKAIRQNNEGL